MIRRWLKQMFGAKTRRIVQAKYDASITDRLNQKHWQNSDALDAVSANSEEVRQKLRERSRYEVSNSPYLRGIIDTQAAYTVGKGPTLALNYVAESTPETRAAATQVEQLWQQWAKARNLTQKLHQMQIATDTDGEAFGLVVSSDRMMTPISLDFRLYEADQFALPFTFQQSEAEADSGVRINEQGDPIAYAFLDHHPGTNEYIGLPDEFTWINAQLVLHMFRQERPGQLRGIPRTTASLPLSALRRRFTLATVEAAETAADLAAVFSKDVVLDEPEGLDGAARQIEIQRGMLLELEDGTKVQQMKAEHPTTTYEMFTGSLLREEARPFAQPAVLASGDASGYNYASGRLDLQSFQQQMSVSRMLNHEVQVLNRLWEMWLDEALTRNSLSPGLLPQAFASQADMFAVSFRWSEPEHVDRAKEAQGQSTELTNKTTTLAREAARRGEDWLRQADQLQTEVEEYRARGLVHPADMAGQTVVEESAGDEEIAEESAEETSEVSRG